MAFASTSVHVAEQALKNGCRQCLFPQGDLQLSPASPGDSPRSAGRSDPGSFQITASSLGPRACEILYVPFKSLVSISHNPLGLLKASPADQQSQTFWGLVFLVQDPQARELDVGLRPLAS